MTQKRTSPKPSPEPPANAAAAGVVTKVNRAQIAHARVVATFAKRIRAAFAHGFEVYYIRTVYVPEYKDDAIDLRDMPGIVEAMAERLAAHAEAVVASYNVPPRVRPGVCERIAEHWNLGNIPTPINEVDHDFPTILAPRLMDMEYQAERAGLIPPRIVWPSNVSLDDIRATLERSPDDDACVLASTFREGRWFVATPESLDGRGKVFPGELFPKLENYTIYPDNPFMGHITDPSFSRALRSTIYTPRIAALIAWAEKTLTEAHTRAGAFALPSTAVQRAALAHVSTGSKWSAWKTVNQMGGRRVFLRVRWEGKLKPVQLALSFTYDITETVLGAVLDELSDDGLLDWLVLHKMADEQGRTGEFRWTWERHRQLAGYDKRVREGWKRHDKHGAVVRVTDDELRRACTRHLWQLTRAELFDEIEGKLARSPVGDGPFLAITAIGDPKGLRPDGDFTVALMAWNAVLYEGAHRDARAPHHTGIPSGIFNLRGPARRLAVFLCLSERMHRDDGMYVTLSESSLMLYAGIRGDGKPSRRHITDARKELARHLEAVHAEISDGSAGTWRTGPTGRVYDHAPARWRVERDLLGAAPDRPALRLDVPRTGTELKAWRDARKLSQREVAELLGVSERTIRTAEKAATALLPRSFRDVDWGKQVPGHAQLANRKPPIEGGDAGGGGD